jgi:hypothetical protein
LIDFSHVLANFGLLAINVTPARAVSIHSRQILPITLQFGLVPAQLTPYIALATAPIRVNGAGTRQRY